MNLLRLNVLIFVAGILLTTISGFAKAAIEIDGMSIDISQTEFLKKRPAAKSISFRPDEYLDYVYFPNNYSLSGFTGTVLGRIFVKGNGCAASVSFADPGRRYRLRVNGYHGLHRYTDRW